MNSKHAMAAVARTCIVLIAVSSSIAPTYGQPVESANTLQQQPSEDLSTKQQRLADRYDQLEILASRLAELSRATQPRRARLLRELVAKSRESDIAGRFDLVVQALGSERMGRAATVQSELQVDLQKLLDLLLQEDRDKQIESERKRIRKYLAELKKLIQLQRGIKARTDGGEETEEVTADQDKLSTATGELGEEIEQTEGLKSDKANRESPGNESSDSDADEPSAKQGDGKSTQEDGERNAIENVDPSNADAAEPADPSNSGNSSEQPQNSQPSPGGQPSDASPAEGQAQSGSDPGNGSDSEQSPSPAQRAQQRLQKAQQRMQQAIDQLEQAKRDNAVEQQEQALRELEQAKAELERILRQLREEEMERMLVMLEARFRKMLDAQVIVYEQTKLLHESEASAPRHEVEIASSRLARQEAEITREADRALVLLREDGTTVAFPEAIEQARDDMRSVEKRLAQVKIAVITQGLEEDIVTALEETLAALQQALKEARAQKGQPQQGAGEPGDQALVDQLAELRMIRALQDRINRRTKRYGDIIGDQVTADPDLRDALEELAIRQERVFQATRDLDSGRNK